MSNQVADLGSKFLDGTLGQAESGVEKGAATASESASSSYGSNETQPNFTPSDAASTLQRPKVTFEDSTANLPPATITPSQQQEAANLLPNSTSAAEAEADAEAEEAEAKAAKEAEVAANAEKETETEQETSTEQTAAATVAGGLFQLAKDSRNQDETPNQSWHFPHQLLGRTSAGNTDYQLPASNLPTTIINPLPPISTTSGIGSPFLSRQPFLDHINSMRQQQEHEQEHSAVFGPGPHESWYQNLLGQGIGSTIIHHPNDAFQLQNLPQQSVGLSLPAQLESLQLPINSNSGMKMSWPDSSPSALPLPNFPSLNLHSPPQGYQTQFYNPYNNIRYLRNSLYDPMYEVLGLPVDPHLRMFMAKRKNNGDDKGEKRLDLVE